MKWDHQQNIYENKTIPEKNWAFVNYKNQLHVVYNWYPLQIGKINYRPNEIWEMQADNKFLINFYKKLLELGIIPKEVNI